MKNEIDLSASKCPYPVYTNGGNSLTPYIKLPTKEIWLSSEGSGCGDDVMLQDTEGWTDCEVVREYGEFDLYAMRKDADAIRAMGEGYKDDADWLTSWCDRVAEVMSNVRYATIDERLDGTGDQFTEDFKSKDEAVDAASRAWDYLTTAEKSKRHICAVWSIADDDGAFDWGNYDIVKEFRV